MERGCSVRRPQQRLSKLTEVGATTATWVGDELGPSCRRIAERFNMHQPKRMCHSVSPSSRRQQHSSPWRLDQWPCLALKLNKTLRGVLDVVEVAMAEVRQRRNKCGCNVETSLRSFHVGDAWRGSCEWLRAMDSTRRRP
jgi:hypothetical protein